MNADGPFSRQTGRTFSVKSYLAAGVEVQYAVVVGSGLLSLMI